MFKFANWLSGDEGLEPEYEIHDNNLIPWQLSYVRWKRGIDGWRLPTEAEWEYAARGGTKSRGCRFSGSNAIKSVAWSVDNANGKTKSVGLLDPNELGLYDMSASVWEWCLDSYDADYWDRDRGSDPVGPGSGSYVVLRGGSREHSRHDRGFRLVRDHIPALDGNSRFCPQNQPTNGDRREESNLL